MKKIIRRRQSVILTVLLAFLSIMLLMPGPAASDRLKWTQTSVTVSQTGTTSTAFEIPIWATYAGALFPAMDDGAIGLEMSMNGGTNYYPVLDSLSGTDAVLCASGSDPGWVDFSDFALFLQDDGASTAQMLWRFTCAAQNSAAVTIYVFFRGY